MFVVFQKSKHKSPDSPNGLISNPPPPPPPLEVEVVVDRYSNLSPPSTDAVNVDIPVVVVPSSSAPPEVVRRRRRATATRFAGKSNEEAASILIQTVFRGYLVCSPYT